MSFGQLAFLVNAMSQCYTNTPSLSNSAFKKHAENKMNASGYALVYPHFTQGTAEKWLCDSRTGIDKCALKKKSLMNKYT